MSTVPPSIADAYDPEKFREQGHRLIDAVADALANSCPTPISDFRGS